MKATGKVAVIVGIQVAIIIASFVTLSIFEEQQRHAGNLVNVAGKNRFLTSDVLNNLRNYLLDTPFNADPVRALEEFEHNIRITKDGGNIGDIHVSPLPAEYLDDWNLINEEFLKYKQSVLEIKNNYDLQGIEVGFDVIRIERETDSLTTHSENLTNKLSLYVGKTAEFLINLQILFTIVNIAAHIFLILLIVRIFRNEEQKSLKNEKMFTVGELSSRLTHDLRNPLTVINTATDLIEFRTKNDMDEKSKRNLDMIKQSAEQMKYQIEEVLDYVRVRPILIEECSMKEILDASMKTIKVPDNVQVELPETDMIAKCDRRQMEVVLDNLITNGIQAIGKNEGKVTVELEKNDGFIINIKDSGPGIPEDKIKNIFEPLYTTKEYGTGLGLVSCKSIIKQHKGKITVKNNPTTFSIHLPK